MLVNFLSEIVQCDEIMSPKYILVNILFDVFILVISAWLLKKKEGKHEIVY